MHIKVDFLKNLKWNFSPCPVDEGRAGRTEVGFEKGRKRHEQLSFGLWVGNLDGFLIPRMGIPWPGSFEPYDVYILGKFII